MSDDEIININLCNPDNFKSDPFVIELDNDNDSTNTEKNEHELNSNLNNFSVHFQKFSRNNDENLVICLFKISDFKNFLNNKKEIESECFDFYLPRFDIKLIGKAILFPRNENFSITMNFLEERIETDNFCLFSSIENSKDLNYETKSHNNKSKVKKNSKIYENESYYKQFSNKLVNLLVENDISFDLSFSLYSKKKNTFIKTKKEKLKLKSTNSILIENFQNYQDLLYDDCTEPFILRIRLSAPIKLPEKCDDFVGLVNEGNTCYLNSIIQSLYHLTLIRKSVYHIPSAEDTPIFAFQKIFYSLQHEKTPHKVAYFFRALNWEKSFWNTQQDAQEIFSVVFGIIADSERGFFGDNGKIEHLCEGILTTSLKCLDSDYESKKEEKFLFLQLDIENKNYLIECIEGFVSVESLKGDNKYETDDKIKHEATKSFSFKKLPHILFVQLKRFKYDGADMIKIHSKLEYPAEIDLSSYISNKIEDLFYSLYAVIVHEGNINYGHYFCLIKDFAKERWIKFNDTKVTIAEEDEVFEKCFGGQEEELKINSDGEIYHEPKEYPRTAYILIYVQKDQIKEIFHNNNAEDIPEALLQIINSPRNVKNSTSTYNYGVSNKNIRLNNTITNTNKPNIAPNKDNHVDTSFYDIEINLKDYGIETNNESNNIYGYRRFPIKDQDRNINRNNSSKVKKNNLDSTKENIIHKILHNKPENNQSTNKNLDLKSITNNDNFKDFARRRHLLKTLKIHIIDNSKSTLICTVSIDKSFDRKIPAISFLEECFLKLKENTNTNVELTEMCIVILNKIGIITEIIDNSRDIEDLLYRFTLEEIFICLYVMNFNDIYKADGMKKYAIHLMCPDFSNKNEVVNFFEKHKRNIPPFLPVILMLDQVTNLNKLRKEILQFIQQMYPEVQDKETKYERLIDKDLNKFTQIKITNGISVYDFTRLENSTDLDKDKFLRLALESECFN